MANNLHFEFNKIAKNKRHLKKLLNSTKCSLEEISKSGYFSMEQLNDILLSDKDRRSIQDITENPIGIIIFGSRSWAKATILNELLGYALLPVSSPQDKYSDNWRTVRIMHGSVTQVSLAVANCYELVEHLAIYEHVWHQIPRSDLELGDSPNSNDSSYYAATLEIKLPHQLLADDVQIIVAPSSTPQNSFESIYNSCVDGITPLVIYALSESDSLNPTEVDNLMELRRLAPKMPIYFIKMQRSLNNIPSKPESFSESNEFQQHLLSNQPSLSSDSSSTRYSIPKKLDFLRMPSPSCVKMSPSKINTEKQDCKSLYQQLCSLGFVIPNSTCHTGSDPFYHPFILDKRKCRHTRMPSHIEVNSELVENFADFKSILPFSRSVMQCFLVEAANILHDVHNRCLRMFILTAFDMTRDMMITPKRIEYAKHKELQLFDSLMFIANKKQEEIKTLIMETISSMKEDLIVEAGKYQFKSNTRITDSEAGTQLNSSGEDVCKSSSPELSGNISGLKALLMTNPLSSSSCGGGGSPSRGSNSSSSSCSLRESDHRVSAREFQIAMSELQDFVLSSLNSSIADKLIGSVNYLRDSYIGTLERCLESLENFPDQNGRTESLYASNALKQILNAAYQVEINMRATSSLLRALWEKMKQIVTASLSWRNQLSIDEEWKKRVACDVLESLSESRLAKSICAQFKERLKVSHDQFAHAMKQLEAVHTGRLERTEEQRFKVRKYYAPRIARFALESTSLRDVILYGMPQLGREIGRGQYGVVYACDSWGGCSPVALKSMVPPDDKHWNDLALEFYYTRSMPEHERIVQIRGSVIDHSYGGGSTPAVLLIMDRLSRDLYSAIKSGIDWLTRLQIAIDVVQGIRFLHSQGLVHRDIKLKNVLLDKKNRAKITDLGFCKPEAMMSGSIVGTPIHMAPELFTGKYDNSVDVYAFGILFWYICAGHVRLPYIFEQCQNKDQLWKCVRRGVRPERLPKFDDECWLIMQKCWAKDPSQRPLLGDIEPKLVSILENYKMSKPPIGYNRQYMKIRSLCQTYHVPSQFNQVQQENRRLSHIHQKCESKASVKTRLEMDHELI